MADPCSAQLSLAPRSLMAFSHHECISELQQLEKYHALRFLSSSGDEIPGRPRDRKYIQGLT